MKLDYFVEHDIYAGLSGFELDADEFSLGKGLTLRRVYAHLMAPFMMAFARPEPGKAHPAPWKAALGGLGFDVTVELVVNLGCDTGSMHRVDATRLIVALLRLWVAPSVMLPILSNVSFSEAAAARDDETYLFPFEVQGRLFPLDAADGTVPPLERIDWVKNSWRGAIVLFTSSEPLRLALNALDSVQFIRDPGLALVSMWGGLEALFSPARSELRFRISALIASYLTPFGEQRSKLQKKIATLYDSRSAAAHGSSKHNPQVVLETYDILRRVVIKMISEQHVPSREELDAHLFGS